MSGSLQQALPVIFRAGSSDSSELANRFYRVPVEQNESWLDLLSLTPRPAPSIFSTVKNTQEARMLFEGLKTAEAIAMLPGRAVKIKTPTIPAKIDQKKLSEIENEYARRLLTPLTQIEREQTISHMAALSSAAGTDAELQAIFSLYGGYLTVAMVAKLLGKSENTARNKLKKLVPHILEQQSVPRLTPSGKTPTVFSLKKGTRKHEFLEHRIATAEILVNTALLSTVAHYTILEIQSDDTLKAAPLKLPHGNILVPDGSARLVSQNYEYTIFYEIDRSTESKEIITNKLTAYKTLASQCECMVVAFCVVEGGDLRVKTLKNWAADVLSFELRELFLFTTIDLDTLTPETLFLSPIWSSIGHTASQPLLEL